MFSINITYEILFIYLFIYSYFNVMAKGFRFMPLGLGANLMQVLTRVSAHRADVSLRNITIAKDDGTG